MTPLISKYCSSSSADLIKLNVYSKAEQEVSASAALVLLNFFGLKGLGRKELPMLLLLLFVRSY